MIPVLIAIIVVGCGTYNLIKAFLFASAAV
jgi:hypothetical protein